MENNWNKFKLSEALEIKYGKDHKKVESGNIPIYGTGGVMRYGNQFLYDKETILIPRKGSLNNIYYLNQPFWCVDTIFWSKVNELLAFPKYLYYSLKILDFASMDVGSAVPSLTTEVLKRIDIRLPTLKEQIAIASILSALDDKIELNLQMNNTLEEMAMALYKRWFVDFGPFQNGKFIDSELGMIPEGWEVKRLDEIARKKSTTFNFSDKTNVVFVNTGDVQEGRFLHSNRISKTGLPGQAKKMISEGDILYSEIRPKNKRFAFVNFDSSDYVVSTKFMIINPKSNILNRLLYRILTMQSMVDNFDSIAEGRSGTFPQITFDAISDVQIILPPMKIQNQFQDIVSAMELQQDELYTENQALIKLRDNLLPKLISGEVRVKDIQQLVEASL